MLTHLVAESDSGPVILWGMTLHRKDELEHMKQTLAECGCEMPYTLIAFQVSDWNREFSPWKTEVLDASFSGGGEDTLHDLLEELIPSLRAKYGTQRSFYIMGYSLAGLFALWCLYQTDLFAGAASCSGSLWYPYFISYMNTHTAFSGKRIYLSLGGKEAKTGDPLMATVGECTEQAYKILKQKNHVKYELNSGGHFADSGKRLAKAVRFLAEKGERSEHKNPEKTVGI